eukprot:363782-Chlamydomonas_euryale.AAC.6
MRLAAPHERHKWLAAPQTRHTALAPARRERQQPRQHSFCLGLGQAPPPRRNAGRAPPSLTGGRTWRGAPPPAARRTLPAHA